MAPLLFVHGVAHGGWCWDEHFVPYFRERGYEAVAIDLRGHGARKGIPLRWIPLSAYVDDVREAAAKLPEPPVLIGHSMGGAITQRYLSSGGRAAAAVLVASVPHYGALPGALLYARSHPLRLLGVAATFSFKPLAGSVDAFATFFSKKTPRGEIERLQPLIQEESYRAGFIDLTLMAFSPPRPAGVPVLVLAAGDDLFFRPAAARSLARHHGAEFELFEGMGHDLMLDVGWEAVAQRIERFLAALPEPARA